MGDRIQISRLGERFSSHTQTPHRRSRRAFDVVPALREKLIEATAEVLADGSSPRLGRSRALL